jgi:hypothetical protein
MRRSFQVFFILARSRLLQRSFIIPQLRIVLCILPQHAILTTLPKVIEWMQWGIQHIFQTRSLRFWILIVLERCFVREDYLVWHTQDITVNLLPQLNLFFLFYSCLFVPFLRHGVCYILVYYALQWFEFYGLRERIPHILPLFLLEKSFELCEFCVIRSLQKGIPHIKCDRAVSTLWHTVWI